MVAVNSILRDWVKGQISRVASRHRARRRNPAVLPSPWRPSDPGGPVPREPDAA